MTLYPKIRNVKNGNIAIKIMVVVSLLASIICLIINLCTTKKLWWSLIVIAGIIYSWITVSYSLHRNVNIASSVMVQSIAVSLLTICIDYIIGYTGWAINLAIPIIISIANITLFVLTIVSTHKYYRYVVYQLIIFALSLIPLFLQMWGSGIIFWPIFTIISSGITVFTFLISAILCGKSMVEELNRRLHM